MPEPTDRSTDQQTGPLSLRQTVTAAMSQSSLISEAGIGRQLGPKKLIIPRNQIQVGSGNRIAIKPKALKLQANPLAEETKSGEEQIDTRTNKEQLEHTLDGVRTESHPDYLKIAKEDV